MEESSEEDEDDEDGDEMALLSLWKWLSPPTEEEEIVGKWFALVYESKKKSYVYVGKALKRFLQDVNGLAIGLEMNCLKPKIGSGDVLESYDVGQEDIAVVKLSNIISGPLSVTPLRHGKWQINGYSGIINTFDRVKKLDRESLLTIEL